MGCQSVVALLMPLTGTLMSVTGVSTGAATTKEQANDRMEKSRVTCILSIAGILSLWRDFWCWELQKGSCE